MRQYRSPHLTQGEWAETQRKITSGVLFCPQRRANGHVHIVSYTHRLKYTSTPLCHALFQDTIHHRGPSPTENWNQRFSIRPSIYLTVWVFSFCLILESYLSIDQDFVCLNWSLIGYFRHVPRICNRLLGHCSPAICQWVLLCHTQTYRMCCCGGVVAMNDGGLVWIRICFPR